MENSALFFKPSQNEKLFFQIVKINTRHQVKTFYPLQIRACPLSMSFYKDGKMGTGTSPLRKF